MVSQQNDRVWAFSSSTEERIATRHQNSQSVMGLAANTETGRFPLLFVSSGIKLNSQRYVADILEGCLLPRAKKHFQEISLSLQQNSSPSHSSKITQSWIQRKIPLFISKEIWSARSSDLNLQDFSIGQSWRPRPAVEALKAKLAKEWAAIHQETIREACALFSARLRGVVKNKRH